MTDVTDANLPPYARMLGLRVEGGVVTMAFADHLIGAPVPPRLHGGTVAGLLEIAANLKVRAALGADDSAQLKPINVTVNYLRGGGPVDSHAEAIIVRLGRRVANVRVEAWQDDRQRLIATAQLNILIDRPPAA